MSINARPRRVRPADPTAVIAKWIPRFGLPLAILAWAAVAFVVLWLAGQIIHTILLLSFAAILAYTIAPAAKALERVMPRLAAILVVYLVVFGVLSVLLYIILNAAFAQINSLSEYVRFLLTPGTGGQLNPFEEAWTSLGISQSQVNAARDLLVANMEALTGSIVPLLTGLVSALLDIILVSVLSIYLLLDGARLSKWLRENMPLLQQERVSFFLDTVQRVVGGYIRGQLILCLLIGVLVGVGMQVIGVPYALLLGVLAFILAFIPVLGTLVSGAICLLLGLTQGWIIAVVVLIYFVVVHLIESDVVGPRIVGQTIGLHPVVSIAVLIAGAELFGIGGALFASPVAGVLQAMLIASWLAWRLAHAGQFAPVSDDLESEIAEVVADEVNILKSNGKPGAEKVAG